VSKVLTYSDVESAEKLELCIKERYTSLDEIFCSMLIPLSERDVKRLGDE
jgi:hypothetical protein